MDKKKLEQGEYIGNNSSVVILDNNGNMYDESMESRLWVGETNDCNTVNILTYNPFEPDPSLDDNDYELYTTIDINNLIISEKLPWTDNNNQPIILNKDKEYFVSDITIKYINGDASDDIVNIDNAVSLIRSEAIYLQTTSIEFTDGEKLKYGLDKNEYIVDFNLCKHIINGEFNNSYKLEIKIDDNSKFEITRFRLRTRDRVKKLDIKLIKSFIERLKLLDSDITGVNFDLDNVTIEYIKCLYNEIGEHMSNKTSTMDWFKTMDDLAKDVDNYINEYEGNEVSSKMTREEAINKLDEITKENEELVKLNKSINNTNKSINNTNKMLIADIQNMRDNARMVNMQQYPYQQQMQYQQPVYQQNNRYMHQHNCHVQ